VSDDWLAEAPKDGGLSSLSTAARQRRERTDQFVRRIAAWVDTWRCVKCGVMLHPHQNGRRFYCSDRCRDASAPAYAKYLREKGAA
jgi:hypothetical protein